MTKPRVWMLAEACNPEWHSLPALIYRYYEALLPYCDITLVTQVRNRPNIEKVRPAGVEVHYLDTEPVAGPLFKLANLLARDANKAMTLKVAIDYPSNLYFELCAWRAFKDRIQAGEFDLVHRASPMSPTLPSPIASWSPIPFVVGPLLGGLAWPAQYAAEMHREGEWMNYVRGAHRLLPYYHSMYARAAAVLAAYKHTIDDIPEVAQPRVVEFSEGGIDPADYPKPERKPKDQVDILFVGRLVPFKCPEVLVRCFAQSAKLRRHKLTIVGDGPEKRRLEDLIEKHSLQDCISMPGTVPHAEVIRLMNQSEIFAFPSIREQGGGVLTMASMCEMANVVVDYGGPASRVPDGCGVRVPMGNLSQLVERFTAELEALVDDPERVKRYGENARIFTERHYAWDAKARKTLEVYDWVLGRRANKPSSSDAEPARSEWVEGNVAR